MARPRPPAVIRNGFPAHRAARTFTCCATGSRRSWSESVLADDPQLTTRLPDGPGRDPLRVVVDSQLRIPLTAKLLQQESSTGTLIATCRREDEKVAALEALGAEVLCLPAEADRVSLSALWQELGKRDVQRLLLEGGATLAGAALRQDLIDQLMVYVAPKLIGGSAVNGIFAGEGCQKLVNAVPLAELRYQQVGKEILISGEVKKCSQV